MNEQIKVLYMLELNLWNMGEIYNSIYTLRQASQERAIQDLYIYIYI